LTASLPEERRQSFLAGLSEAEAEALCYDWRYWARPDQLQPEGDWSFWLLMAGRGAGKTRAGAEWVQGEVRSGRRGRLGLVGATAADVRDVMVEGDSGLLAIADPEFRPRYQSSVRRLTWPNGAVATTYSADEPERLRGPQHDGIWADEVGTWRYPAAWDNMLFGLRVGADPRAVVTTTPRPTKLVRAILNNPHTVVTRATTYDNLAFLAPSFFEQIVRPYEGTRLGRQELQGELLEDVEGALWRRDDIDELRVSSAPDLQSVVVAIDPAVTSGEGSDETGIIVAGSDDRDPTHGYVLADLSGRYRPEEWSRIAIEAYRKYHADRIIGEANNGGDLIESVLRTIDPNISYRKVHASRGKFVRAEPVSTLYEKRRVHHVGVFPRLEDQMANFTADIDRKTMGSPDRVDALVWAFHSMMVGRRGFTKPPATSRKA